MKPIRAWAIIENNKLAVYDYRLPIMWDKAVAKKELSKMSGNIGRLVEVEIRLKQFQNSKREE